MSNPPSTPSLDDVAREFPAWEIGDHPAGLDAVVAYWRSPDGRHRRVIAAPDTVQLLDKLRRLDAK